jgi:NADPH2:quinone reductase
MTIATKQIVLSQYGSPDVLLWTDAQLPSPKAGEVIIKTEAIGVNYADTLRRRNKYFQPTPLPYVLGSEAVGEIVQTGEGVQPPFVKGARVLAILPAGGGYSQFVTAMAQYCVPLPPNISSPVATALFVQGSTAQLMMTHVARELKGKSVLVTAAVGGVGSLLVQLAKLSGATVLAASSSKEKLNVAKANGADALINYSQPGWQKQVRQATNGRGVDVAFETVGGEVYNETVQSLAAGGHLIIYGCASGIQGNVRPEYFVDENLTQSGFNLAHYITHHMPQWQEALGTVIGLVAQGQVKVSTAQTFALKDAAEAHRQLEARQTTGKIVLTA